MAQTVVPCSAAAEVGAWGLQIAMTLSLQPVVSLSLSLVSSLCVCARMVDEALAERLGYFRPPSVHARLAGPPRVCGCTALGISHP